VIVKAGITRGELNPRFVLTREPGTPEQGYHFYCGRGDSQNRIKRRRLDTDSGRTRCHRFVADPLRLLLPGAAPAAQKPCVLLCALPEAAKQRRRAKAQVGTLRLCLPKVGARVVQSYRTVWPHLWSAFAEQAAWTHLHRPLAS
jgi:hypothetical protein